MPEPTIPRGADLTEEDLALLAEDARVVTIWAMQHRRLKREAWGEQILQALRVRLGRRPLDGVGDA